MSLSIIAPYMPECISVYLLCYIEISQLHVYIQLCTLGILISQTTSVTLTFPALILKSESQYQWN